MLRLRGFGSGRHGRVPVEQAGATVACKQLSLAELVPSLWADAHAASGTLLILSTGQAGAAGAGEAIEMGEQVRLDELTKRFSLGVERGQFGTEFLVAEGDAGASFIQYGGLGFHLGAGGGERGLLGFSALQAGKGFVLKAFGLGGCKADFVLDGLGLLRGFYGVELGAEAGGFLAVGGNFALETGAQGFFTGEGVGGFGSLALGGS